MEYLCKSTYKIYYHFTNGRTDNDHSVIYVWFQTLPDAQTKTVHCLPHSTQYTLWSTDPMNISTPYLFLFEILKVTSLCSIDIEEMSLTTENSYLQIKHESLWNSSYFHILLYYLEDMQWKKKGTFSWVSSESCVQMTIEMFKPTFLVVSWMGLILACLLQDVKKLTWLVHLIQLLPTYWPLWVAVCKGTMSRSFFISSATEDRNMPHLQKAVVAI